MKVDGKYKYSMQVFFVIGPESSGTKFLTKALLLATNGYGEAEDNQSLGNDDVLKFPDSLPETIVFRRSLPHGNKWPNIKFLWEQFSYNGYNIMPILILRDPDITIKSQIKNGHVKTPEEARENIKKYKYIYDELPVMPTITTYESLMITILRQSFFQSIGLEFPKELEVINGNAKYLQ